MSELHFYADAEAIDVLLADTSKAILVGSDFGYGNFGDVLQHAGSISRIAKCSSMAVVSVLSLDAISRYVSIAALRRGYGAAALIFASVEPISPELKRQFGLVKVISMRNIACLQLYGGGFLNEMWGDFVVGVAEYFLRRAPSAWYFISGQQISPKYAERVAKHIREFRPLLVGVRDRDSLRYLQEKGVDAKFSFDDAVEPLLLLSEELRLQRGSGLFLHLNSSGYTGNDAALMEMDSHLRTLADREGSGRAILFQAFQDAREEVIDSLETVKRLEGAVPFGSLDVVMLVSLITGMQPSGAPSRTLTGAYGYACSYHITLWLQLNGIPCWLRGSNPYYDQKRRSLGVEGDFEAFLEHMPLVDHAANIAARQVWTELLESMISKVGPALNRLELPDDSIDTQFRSLGFKGEPRLSVRLDQSWAAVRGLQEEKALLAADLDQAHETAAATKATLDQCTEEFNVEREQLWGRLQEYAETISNLEQQSNKQNEQLFEIAQSKGRQLAGRVEALSEQVTYLGSECRTLVGRLRDAERGWQLACLGNEQLASSLSSMNAEREEMQRNINQLNEELLSTAQRLLACTEQLTFVGGEAREQRQQAESTYKLLREVGEREVELTRLLQQVHASRSWRVTRPMRVLNRFMHTGRFDPAGQVGAFEACKRVGKRLPLPDSWVPTIGRFLRKLRRS